VYSQTPGKRRSCKLEDFKIPKGLKQVLNQQHIEKNILILIVKGYLMYSLYIYCFMISDGFI